MGPEAGQMHYELGKYAVENGMELLLCCGELGRETARGAGDRGVWFESREELAKALPRFVNQGDTVLVKASRGMHLEEIADELKRL